jgi:hypothetical protein
MSDSISLTDIFILSHGLAIDDTKGVYKDGKYFVRMFGQKGEAYYPVISEETVDAAIEYAKGMSNDSGTKAVLEYLKHHLRIEHINKEPHI